jgi:hypothetical protein
MSKYLDLTPGPTPMRPDPRAHAYASPFKFSGQLDKVDFQLQPMDVAGPKMSEETGRGEAEVK